MGVVESTKWTCDRCGAVAEEDERNWQPDDWGNVWESVPPKKAANDGEHVAVLWAFIDRAEAFLDEGLFGLVSPQQAFRNAAIARTEVQ